MSKRIVVFGATGATGSHIVRQALEQGFTVRAFVRTPSKVPADLAENSNLEIFKGDLKDKESIHNAIEGCDIVLSHAGNAAASKKSYFMLGFVKQVIKSMREHGVKRLLYQAGAFSPAPGATNPFFVRAFMRPVLGGIIGISGMLRDNDAVIEFLSQEAPDIDWTVTRPGMLKEKPSKGTLHASDGVSGAIHFVDLAAFSLATASTDAHIRECPYLSY